MGPSGYRSSGVQRFATKLCTKSWSAHSYDERLHLLNLDSLNKRRAFLKLCHLYKLVHGQSASYITFILTLLLILCIPLILITVSPWKCHFLTLILIFIHFFVMQLGCGIHYIIILFHLVFTPLNRIYLCICHSCFIFPCI